ncbi:MAG TPA: DUF4440 domain-containing protein [Longimicrobiales bacterium]|nr:DUF4440 domain-containing protein [Longimicrobiales bacterium]
MTGYRLAGAWLLLMVTPAIARSQVGETWPRPVPDSVRAEVVAELEQYYDDFSSRDWPAFAEHFWPGATLTTIWAPPGEATPRVVAITVPEFVEQAPSGPGSKPIFEERMLEVVVTVQGPLAQAWARYRARFGDPGAVAEWTGVDAFTLLRHDGRWKIVSLGYTDEP